MNTKPYKRSNNLVSYDLIIMEMFLELNQIIKDSNIKIDEITKYTIISNIIFQSLMSEKQTITNQKNSKHNIKMNIVDCQITENPEHYLIYKQKIQTLNKVYNILPEECRELINLIVLKDISIKKVSVMKASSVALIQEKYYISISLLRIFFCFKYYRLYLL